jgi:fructose-bisphosphate aldolase class II
MTGAVRKFLAENPDKFDAREWLKPAREAAKDLQAALCGVRLRRPGRQDQAALYAAGKLAQHVRY